MEPPVFYAPPESFEGDDVSLSADESRHATRVMRLTLGAQVIVIDGLGSAWRGTISRVGPRKPVEVRLHAEVRNFGEPAVILTLAAGLSSGSKFDTVVEKGTELGVKRFVPLLTEKSMVKVEDPRRGRSRRTRLEKVALAAIKQCRRSYRPEVTVPTKFSDYLSETETDSINLIFHPSASRETLNDILAGQKPRRVSLLLGPEAGFSEDELEAAVKAGYTLVSLGERILRTENAAPTATALVMNLLGELS
ncbi:MAG: 16S rRNA (uracil(1498)-N(3))-methyltransferase [candidate division Zixibacteria bacterium]|nr:16S rRNA (uracil(1498)-N(3))-methyltransferase [candidate division Zixibacteria bacterium]